MAYRRTCLFVLQLPVLTTFAEELHSLTFADGCEFEDEHPSCSLHLMQMRASQRLRTIESHKSSNSLSIAEPDIGSEVATYAPTKFDNTDETCDGTDTAFGPKGKMSDAETIEDCQATCSADIECKFIQYQPGIKKCHLYTKCAKTRACENDSCARTLRRLVASTYIPTEYDQTDQTCDGTVDEWGTKGKISESENLEQCQLLCSSNPKCRFVQFQEEIKKCHEYESCKSPRPCAGKCGRTVARLMAGTYVPTMYDRTQQTCDGSESPWGQKGKITEGVKTLQHCRDLCGQEPECRFIQFQAALGLCHLYEECSTPRGCEDACERTLQRLVAGTLIPTKYDNTDMTCDGSDTEWGAKGKVQQEDTLEDCRELCADDVECHFLQFQPELKQCHLYKDCSKTRHCDGNCARTFRRLVLQQH